MILIHKAWKYSYFTNQCYQYSKQKSAIFDIKLLCNCSLEIAKNSQIKYWTALHLFGLKHLKAIVLSDGAICIGQ